MSDNELIILSETKKRQAYNSLFNRHYQALVIRIESRYFLDEETSEEIAIMAFNDTFKAIEKGTYNSRYLFTTLLYFNAKSYFIKEMKYRKRLKRDAILISKDEEECFISHKLVDNLTPYHYCQQNIDAEELHKNIKKILTEKEYEVFYLKNMLEKDYKEISKDLNIEYGNAKALNNRARYRLLKVFNKSNIAKN